MCKLLLLNNNNSVDTTTLVTTWTVFLELVRIVSYNMKEKGNDVYFLLCTTSPRFMVNYMNVFYRCTLSFLQPKIELETKANNIH